MILADGQKYHIDGKTLYAVDFIFDKDIYFRGYDHIVFLKMLSDVGDILHTYWDMEHVPKLSEFAAEDSYLPLVSVLLASEKPEAEISEIFEFLFEHEYAIRAIEAKAAEIAAVKEEIKPQGDAPKKIEEQEQASKLPESKQQTSSVVKKEESAQKSYIKIDTAKLDELFDTVGELVIAQNFIAQNEKIKDLGDSNINKTIETLSKITKTIQDRVMSLRMVAIRDTFEKMKRVARDTAKKAKHKQTVRPIQYILRTGFQKHIVSTN
jgi:two-component system chemotaxis sensor kinase CheA